MAVWQYEEPNYMVNQVLKISSIPLHSSKRTEFPTSLNASITPMNCAFRSIIVILRNSTWFYHIKSMDSNILYKDLRIREIVSLMANDYATKFRQRL